MDLALVSDIYEPSIGNDGNYYDYAPPSSKFNNGLRCPCGARKDHVFDSRTSFNAHIKSKTHKKWLEDLNTNKMNYYTECEKLKIVVETQKIMISKMETDLVSQKNIIDYLQEQIKNKNKSIDDIYNLLSLD